MQIVPAIDLMNGCVVRLEKGNVQTAKTYEQFGHPIHVAKKWVMEGASIIHIIDLDAATGIGNNIQIIKRIIKEVNVPIQLGGGLRSRERVEEMLTLGVERVILGTMAFEHHPELLGLMKQFGKERIMVALDYLNARIMMKGWQTTTQYTLDEALSKFSELGIDNFLLTSIAQDGRLTGPDHTLLKNIVQTTRVNIYAAGGVSTLEDIIRLKETGIMAVIIGKALYEKRFTLREAIQIVKTN